MIRDEEIDELLGLALALANGWPRATAPWHVREEYITALRAVARDLTRKHAARVRALRARNRAEQAVERSE